MPTQRCLDDEGAARGELGAGLQSSQSWTGGQDGELRVEDGRAEETRATRREADVLPGQTS